jgi:uncharacterized protein
MEDDLGKLLEKLSPSILPGTYVFCSVEGACYGELAHTGPIASFAEREGLTLVMLKERADAEGLGYHGSFRCIQLGVYSSLEAIGLTAAVSNSLAKCGISANVIAAYHHDHVFVPEGKAQAALERLENLQLDP